MNINTNNGKKWEDEYVEQLLSPKDWFNFWRLNCRLASYHSLITEDTGYVKEDKWNFLYEGKKLGIPVSPFMDVSNIVVKDKNEEGGMGLYFFKNATEGGDWIIQKKLCNDEFVSSLLPEKSPLSTLRVITSSRNWLEVKMGGHQSYDHVESLSCVFRAGREGSNTDHSCIMFDVDTKTGEILKGTESSHWYKLGLSGLKTDWVSTHDITHHPDNDCPITGKTIPGIENILKVVQESHFKLMPNVPLVGWDVALTSDGIFLLEVNLSCNFFRGSFDVDKYVNLVHEHFVVLEKNIKVDYF